MVLPHPISIVALSTPGRLIGDRLARLIVVVPFEPTENGWNFDSRTLMMSSNRSTAFDDALDVDDPDGLVGRLLFLPHAVAAIARMTRMKAANRMIDIRY